MNPLGIEMHYLIGSIYLAVYWGGEICSALRIL